jgi:hypothetical protein
MADDSPLRLVFRERTKNPGTTAAMHRGERIGSGADVESVRLGTANGSLTAGSRKIGVGALGSRGRFWAARI